MDEFAFIRDRLAPLAETQPGARGLTDDAATLTPPPGAELVITADALVAGVHFRNEDPLDGVAAKALRVNLSDLAAKGAAPLGYLLCVVWPRDLPLDAKTAFVNGLARDQARYGVGLLGGDTTVGPGPLTIAITAFGAVPAGGFVSRAGARPGDGVYVTGTIGDAGLGLRALRGGLDGMETAAGAAAHRDALVRAYRAPEPRLSIAEALRERAHAAIDISDGLVADAGHVARASGVAITIEAAHLPVSPAARAWVTAQPEEAAALATLATGGDDYEVMFTAPDAAMNGVLAFGSAQDAVQVVRIGSVEEGAGVRLLDAEGRAIPIAAPGFTHF